MKGNDQKGERRLGKSVKGRGTKIPADLQGYTKYLQIYRVTQNTCRSTGLHKISADLQGYTKYLQIYRVTQK